MRHLILATALATCALVTPAAAQRDFDVISQRLASIEQTLREGAQTSSAGVVYATVRMKCTDRDQDCNGTALTFCNKGLFRSGVPTKMEDGWLVGIACVK